MQNSNSSFHQTLGVGADESEDDIRFDKSLQELRDLRSQLHYAADYCEMAFLNSKQKKIMLESTKEYVCRAVVTFVDHLGSVSSTIDSHLTKNNAVPEAELRLNCLKQRLLTCQQYTHKLALTRLRWRENFPRHNPRYITTAIPNLEQANGVLRDSDNPSSSKIINKLALDITEEKSRLLSYTCSHKPPLPKNLTSDTTKKGDTNSVTVFPVHDGLPILSKAPNPTFHFQSSSKLGRNTSSRKSLHGNDILSLIRRTKRIM